LVAAIFLQIPRKRIGNQKARAYPGSLLGCRRILNWRAADTLPAAGNWPRLWFLWLSLNSRGCPDHGAQQKLIYALAMAAMNRCLGG